MPFIKQILLRFRIAFFIMAILITSCNLDEGLDEEGNEIETPDWSDLTHGEVENPDYSVVFPSDKVNRIDIVIDEENWEEMLDDLSSKIGSGGGVPGGTVTSADPIWVPCEVYFEGLQWYKVGIRFKGNSSLQSTYRNGLKKFPFKLDFDQFEDDYPAIEDQRFYGFRQLSLKNNFEDRSFLREKVASELFCNFGLASPETAFYAVYIDIGSGVVYFGLYTLVEEVDDTVIEIQFASGDGNLYKPEGTAATFASGTFSPSEMYKKNNLTENDYSDVENLYNIINSSERTNNYDNWKQDLTQIFNVDVFLKWLAANTVMQNWDTYGKMSHNYYLYNNPVNEKLTWIPWDNNEALQSGKQGGALSLSFDEVHSNWPLIRYIINDEEWLGQYQEYVSQFINNLFYPERMDEIYSVYSSIVEEYVVGPNGEISGYSFLIDEADFQFAINKLKQHVTERNEAVTNYLSIDN